jgi:hypothetical protein
VGSLWPFLGGVAPERQFVMIFIGYFDESGTHAGSDAMAIAGYISTKERWCGFDVEWKAALKDYGLDFFHMTDFAAGAGPYQSWSPDEKAARLEHLIGIINRHAQASLGIAIPVKLFHSVFSDKAKRIIGGPYGLAVHRAFLETADLVKTLHTDGMIRYVFESGAEGAGAVLRSYQRSMKLQFPMFKEMLRQAGLSFEDKRCATPLQAADILAYDLRNRLPRTLGLDTRGPRTQDLKRLLSAIPRYWIHLEEVDLAKWSSFLDSDIFDENAMQKTPKSGKQRKRKGRE